jgi:hypothetical protein
LLATGSDGYEAIFSLGELDPMFGGTGVPDLIAYLQDGVPIGRTGLREPSSPETISAGAMSPTWSACK